MCQKKMHLVQVTSHRSVKAHPTRIGNEIARDALISVLPPPIIQCLSPTERVYN